MAIMVPPEVGNLFMVLTGEKWPQINEDELMRLGEAWRNASTRLQNELRPDIAAVVKKIREEFRGRAANRFADRMAPLLDSPGPFDAISESFEGSADFLRKMALQTEYVKLVTILSLVELLAQIAWAIAMSGPTFGASMTWLAARYAIVRFMLNRLWGRLIMRVVEAQVFGILTQVAIDAGAQLIQIAKGSKDFSEWDKKATVQAVEVGALGGALALPLSALGGALGNLFSKTLTNTLGNAVDKQILKAAADSAANKYAKELPNAKSLADFATKISDHMNTHVGKDLGAQTNKNFDGMSLKGMYAHKAGRGLGDVLQQSLHEWLTEATYNASQGEGFQASGFAATAGAVSGMSSHIGNLIGDGIHGNLKPGDGASPFLADSSGKDGQSTEGASSGRDGSGGSGGDSENTTSHKDSDGPNSVDRSITTPETSLPPSGETGDGSNKADSGDGSSTVSVGSDGRTTDPGGTNSVGGQSNSQVSSNGSPVDSSSGHNRDNPLSGDGKPGSSADSSPTSHDQGSQNRGPVSGQSTPSAGPAGTPNSADLSSENSDNSPVSSGPVAGDGPANSPGSQPSPDGTVVHDQSGATPSTQPESGHDIAPGDGAPNATHPIDSGTQQPAANSNADPVSPHGNSSDSHSLTSEPPATSPGSGPATNPDTPATNIQTGARDQAGSDSQSESNVQPGASTQSSANSHGTGDQNGPGTQIGMNVRPGTSGHASPNANTATPTAAGNPASQSTTNNPGGTPKSPEASTTPTPGNDRQRLGDLSVTASTKAPSTPARENSETDSEHVEVQVDSHGRPVDHQQSAKSETSKNDTPDSDDTFSIDDIITPAEAPPDTNVTADTHASESVDTGQSGDTRPARDVGGTVFPSNRDVDGVHRQLAAQNRFGDGNFTAFVSTVVPLLTRVSTQASPPTSRPVQVGGQTMNAEQFADVLNSPESGWNGADPIILVSNDADHHHDSFASELSTALGDVPVTAIRMSDNGNIAKVGGRDGKAYATKETIDDAANGLEGRENSKITVEMGPPLVPGSELREVRPVYKEGVLSTEDARFQPVAGESGAQRRSKFDDYRDSLSNPGDIQEIVKVWVAVDKTLSTLKENDGSLLGSLRKPSSNADTRALREHISAVSRLMSSREALFQKKHATILATMKIEEGGLKPLLKEIMENAKTAYREELTAVDALGAQQLPISLPNDCGGATTRIIANDKHSNPSYTDPNIGENFYKSLGGGSGWGNHYATVVLKDGNTDVTFEAAADFKAKLEESKFHGFFELYRQGHPDLSFGSVMETKAGEYGAEKEAAFPSRNDATPPADVSTPAEAPPQSGPVPEGTSTDNGIGNRGGFTSPQEWGDQRDSAPKAVVNEFSFEPVKEGTGNAKGKGPLFEGGRLTGINGFLPGRNTYINAEIRRFQAPNGDWVREYTIKADLVSKNDQLSPEQRGDVADRVRAAVDAHVNQKYRLPGGDQLHVAVDFDTPKWDDRSQSWDVDSSQRPPVEVHNSQGGANQLRWGTGDDSLVLLHELMHYLGLKDAYESPDTVLNREETRAKNEAGQQGTRFTGDDQRKLGLMGPKFRENPVLTDKNLARIEEISQSSSVLHDHPLNASDMHQPESAPRTDRATSPDPLGNPAQNPAEAPGLERAPWAGERTVTTWSVDPGGQGKLELSHYVHGAQHRFDFGNGVEERYDVDRDWTNNRDPDNRESIARGAQNIRNTRGIGIPDVLWYRLKADQVSENHSLLDGIIDSVADLPKDASWQPGQKETELAGHVDRGDSDQRRLAAHLAALRATVAAREAVMSQLNVETVEVRTGRSANKQTEKIEIDWNAIRRTVRRTVLDHLGHHPEPGGTSGRRPGRVPPSHRDVGSRMTAEFLPDAVRSDPGLRRLAELGLVDGTGRSGTVFGSGRRGVEVVGDGADQLSHAWNHLRFLAWMEWRGLHELLNDGDAGEVLETSTEHGARRLRLRDTRDDAMPADDVITPAQAPPAEPSMSQPAEAGTPREGETTREPDGAQRGLSTIPDWQGPSEPEPSVNPRSRARVLVVSDKSGMGGGGVPVFNMELVKGLSAHHDVTMLTVDPDPGYDNDKKTREHGDAEVVNVATPKGTDPRDFFGQLVTRPAEEYGMPADPNAFDVIIGHSRFSGPGAQEVRQAWYPNAKMVHFLHTSPLRLDRIKGEHGKGARKSKAERVAMRDADLVAGVGPLLTEEAERLSRQIQNVPALHQFVPGTETGPINPRPGRENDSSIKLLLPGRATDEIKGVESAIHAVGILRDLGRNVELTIRGAPDPENDPALHQFWQERADELGRGGVTLKPFTTDAEELAGDRSEADALIMPSLHEGFGLVATEAAGQGVPVLVNSESGAAQFLEQFEELGVPNPMVVATPFTIDPTTSREVAGGAEERARAWAQAIGQLSETLSAGRDNAEELHGLLEQYTWPHAADALVEAALETPARDGDSRHGGITRQGPEGTLIRESEQRPDWEPQGFWDGSTPRPPQYDPETPDQHAERIARLHNTGILVDEPMRPPRPDTPQHDGRMLGGGDGSSVPVPAMSSQDSLVVSVQNGQAVSVDSVPSNGNRRVVLVSASDPDSHPVRFETTGSRLASDLNKEVVALADNGRGRKQWRSFPADGSRSRIVPPEAMTSILASAHPPA